MNFFQIMRGEAKKELVHNIINCIAVKYSYSYYLLHNWVEYCSAMEKSRMISNANRIW